MRRSKHIITCLLARIFPNLRQVTSDPVRTRYFVLKTYNTEDAEHYYSSEITAFRHLMGSNDFVDNMITFYGSWRQNGTYNILLEYADGGTLLDYFKHVPPPTSEEDIQLFWGNLLRVLEALQLIHSLSVVQGRPRVLQGCGSHFPQRSEFDLQRVSDNQQDSSRHQAGEHPCCTEEWRL